MGSSKNSTEETTKGEIASIVNGLLADVYSTMDRNPLNMWNEHKIIREKLQRVTALQASIGDTDEQLASKRSKGSLEDFLAWCDKRGIIRDGVSVEEKEKMGFGLVAERDLNEGEVVITVPRKAIFSLDNARRLPSLRKLFLRDHLASQMDNVGLALGVCALQLKWDPSWLPYLDVLPAQFDCPLYYSLEQIEELRVSPVIDDILNCYRAVSRQFCYFLALIAENDKYDQLNKDEKKKRDPPPLYDTPFTLSSFTFGLYRWAVCTVATRINQIPSESDKNGDKPKIIPCLIPLLDFANHSFARQVKYTAAFSEDEDVAVLPVNETTKKGEALTMQYGCRSTAEFFVHNAFAPSVNPFNKYTLRLGIPKSDTYLDQRIEELKKVGFKGMSNVYVFHIFEPREAGGLPFDEALLKFARIFVSNPPTKENSESADSIRKGLEFLEKRLSLLLLGYEGKKLEGESNTCVLLRQDKALLQSALSYCKTELSAIR